MYGCPMLASEQGSEQLQDIFFFDEKILSWFCILLPFVLKFFICLNIILISRLSGPPSVVLLSEKPIPDDAALLLNQRKLHLEQFAVLVISTFFDGLFGTVLGGFGHFG